MFLLPQIIADWITYIKLILCTKSPKQILALWFTCLSCCTYILFWGNYNCPNNSCYWLYTCKMTTHYILLRPLLYCKWILNKTNSQHFLTPVVHLLFCSLKAVQPITRFRETWEIHVPSFFFPYATPSACHTFIQGSGCN